MIRLVVLLAAVLAAAAGVQGSQATFTASATNGGSSFATAADWVAPGVTITAPAAGSATNDTTPTLTGTAGNATGDSPTVTVNIYSGTSATGTPVQTLTPTRAGTTWSATAATLASGTYTAKATQTDTGGNTGASAPNTFTVDTVAPTAAGIAATNGGAASGKVDAGDQVTFTYSEAIKPASVLSGWTGNATAVKFRVTQASTNDTFVVRNNANTASLPIGTTSNNGERVTATATFAATMTLSADQKSVVVVLGALQGGTVAPSAVPARNMSWRPTATVTDPAGNAATTVAKAETDNDVDF